MRCLRMLHGVLAGVVLWLPTFVVAEPPAWLEGYAIRYQLQVMETPEALAERKTVMASLPTGGWLKPDASDLRVVDGEGRVLPLAVLSHAEHGNTLIQFERSGEHRRYWVYAVNPEAQPQVDSRRLRRIEQARSQAASASVRVMEARRQSAEASGALRDARRAIERHERTLGRVENELRQLDESMPERRQAVEAAEAALPPLARTLQQREQALQKAAAEAARMMNLVQQAEQRVETAKQQAAAAEAQFKTLERRRTAFDDMEGMRRLNEAQASMLAMQQSVQVRQQEETAAREAALPYRMAVAGAETQRDEALKAHRDGEQLINRRRQQWQQAQNQKRAAETLRAETRKELASVRAELPSLEQEATRTSNHAEQKAAEARELEQRIETIVKGFDPRSHREGLVMEVRDWRGDSLDSWAQVREGLEQSVEVLGNAPVTDILQKMNPFRLGSTPDFAASYRGFLRVNTSGLIRFFVNADDAAFLFLNGFLVYSQTGSNRPLGGCVNVFGVGEDMELEAGVYEVELYQITGHQRNTEGRCSFYWIPPGASTWQRVPPEAWVPSARSILTDVTAADGRGVPIPMAGVANTLDMGGYRFHKVHFSAVGGDSNQPLAWDFGDGLKGRGPSPQHVYFGGGDTIVRLQSHPDLPAFKRRLHVWPAPVETSPLTASAIIRILENTDLEALDPVRLAATFAFLSICGQPERWPLMEKVTERLLQEKDLDLQYRVQLTMAAMEAKAQLGRAAEALELGQDMLQRVAEWRFLSIEIERKMADVYRLHLRDINEADRRYASLVENHRRFAFDGVRQAAVSWGDMYMEAGDTGRASEIYRLASSLGTMGQRLAGSTEATTRGALLRVAEQQLRDGRVRHARQLLERIETEFPEQKTEGLYRFLLAEAERHAGRYERAVGHYEVLLRLQQWSGYRPQVMDGLAESHFRMGQSREALTWLDAVRESFPSYYEQQGLEARRELLMADLESDEGLSPEGHVAQGHDERMRQWMETTPPGGGRLQIMSLPGMTSHALVLSESTDRRNSYIDLQIDPMVSEGMYQVDFWYRNDFMHSHAHVNPVVQAQFLDANGRAVGRAVSLPVIRSFGSTFKALALLRAPMGRQGRIRLTLDSFQGVHVVEGLRVRPVSAFQQEALLNFIEGRDTL